MNGQRFALSIIEEEPEILEHNAEKTAASKTLCKLLDYTNCNGGNKVLANPSNGVGVGKEGDDTRNRRRNEVKDTIAKQGGNEPCKFGDRSGANGVLAETGGVCRNWVSESKDHAKNFPRDGRESFPHQSVYQGNDLSLKPPPKQTYDYQQSSSLPRRSTCTECSCLLSSKSHQTAKPTNDPSPLLKTNVLVNSQNNNSYTETNSLHRQRNGKPLVTETASPVSAVDLKHEDKIDPPLTEQEILQVDMFYRGRRSQVFVGNSLVGLYIGAVQGGCSDEFGGADIRIEVDPSEWTFSKHGIPVLVLEAPLQPGSGSGSGSVAGGGKLTFILAERGTGFALWANIITNSTVCCGIDDNLLAMSFRSVATDSAGATHRSSQRPKGSSIGATTNSRIVVVGCRFSKSDVISQFLKMIDEYRLLATNKSRQNGSNGAVNKDSSSSSSCSSSSWKKETNKGGGAGEGLREDANRSATLTSSGAALKGKGSRGGARKPPCKADISSPCCFTHVTKLDRSDALARIKFC